MFLWTDFDNRISETLKEMVGAEVKPWLLLCLSLCLKLCECRDCGLRLQQAVDLTLFGSSQRIQLSTTAPGCSIPESRARKTTLDAHFDNKGYFKNGLLTTKLGAVKHGRMKKGYFV